MQIHSKDEMCAEMGMNLATFFMIYAKKASRDRKIPFEISALINSFYSESNLKQIRSASEQIKNGKVVVKILEELEKLANE